jgi:hypothetical protein
LGSLRVGRGWHVVMILGPDEPAVLTAWLKTPGVDDL